MRPTAPVPTESRSAASAPAATLDSLVPGDRCVVRSIAGGGDARRRLLEMGMVPGTEVRLVRVAPLGDPLAIRLRGYHLSLRRTEARTVVVERV